MTSVGGTVDCDSYFTAGLRHFIGDNILIHTTERLKTTTRLYSTITTAAAAATTTTTTTTINNNTRIYFFSQFHCYLIPLVFYSTKTLLTSPT